LKVSFVIRAPYDVTIRKIRKYIYLIKKTKKDENAKHHIETKRRIAMGKMPSIKERT